MAPRDSRGGNSVSRRLPESEIEEIPAGRSPRKTAEATAQASEPVVRRGAGDGPGPEVIPGSILFELNKAEASKLHGAMVILLDDVRVFVRTTNQSYPGDPYLRTVTRCAYCQHVQASRAVEEHDSWCPVPAWRDLRARLRVIAIEWATHR
jgi:hypothetical protein